MSHSNERLKLAEEAAEVFRKHFGKDLIAVFVTGSVAAKMASQSSDIDLVVISNSKKRTENERRKVHSATDLNLIQKKVSHHVGVLSREVFENPNGKKMLNDSVLLKQVMDGAIPIFGKEYAQKNLSFWRPPKRKTIRVKYKNKPKKGQTHPHKKLRRLH